MTWIAFDAAYVLDSMPDDVRTAYTAWIAAHPEKAGRLAVLAGQFREGFRQGLARDPTLVMDADETLLLSAAVPYAQVCVIYSLMMEMGLSVNMSAITAYNNAQVYMRRLFTAAVGESSGVNATPSFNGRDTEVDRMLWG